MTFTQLEVFSLVAQLQGFTAAALRLGISQSAVSHAIKSLEKELGVALIERGLPTVELTEAGKRLVTRAREIVGLADAMRQEAAGALGLCCGKVRIGSFGPTSSLKLLPAILCAFREKYPGIDVEIEEGSDDEVRQWIIDRRVDVGFVVMPDDDIDTVQLVEDQILAILPRSHPLANQASVSVAELAALPFVAVDSGCFAPVASAFARARMAPKVRYRMTQVMTILGMVQAGEGVSAMAELALPTGCRTSYPDVVALPFRPAIPRRVGLGMRSLEHASPAVQAFVDTAKRVARKKLPA